MYTAAYYGVRSPNLICAVSLPMASYERFAAWKLSYDLALKVYDATDSFPSSELYGLTSQIRRAAFSVAANIAEGAAKRGRREFRRYLDIALGSITEVEVALRLARDRRYLTHEAWEQLERLRNHAGAVTWRLYQAVR
ncbi:MAG: hypothetical protein DMD42_09225 [Gemmatimonadetes bacterium]|nr:MAG: hypothetical protein DMD42_09225 [Gemmatimonadota bacterium]